MNYPSCFKSLLRHAAYDSKSSCLLLDEETLANMEEYITHTGKEVISRLNCCNAEKYQSQDRFRFLPGHRSLILSMPNQIRNMDSVKKKKSKPLREFKKLLTPTELKQLLLIKLNEASEKNGYSVGSYKDTHLKNVQTMITNNELMAKCSVQCFLCQATVTSLYTGWWAVNNVIRHLKSVHYSGERTGLETGSIAQSQNDAECKYKLTDVILFYIVYFICFGKRSPIGRTGKQPFSSECRIWNEWNPSIK